MLLRPLLSTNVLERFKDLLIYILPGVTLLNF